MSHHLKVCVKKSGMGQNGSSGLTAHVDPYGRVMQTAPYYEPAYLVADAFIEPDQPITVYTRAGDYFPASAGGLLAAVWLGSLVVSLVERVRRRRRKQEGEPPLRRTAPRRAEPPRTKPEPPPRTKPEPPPRTRPPQDHARATAESIPETLTSSTRSVVRRKRKKRQPARNDWRAIWDE